MTVNDLRDTLNQLVGLLRATDAKAGTIRELSEFIEETRRFHDLTLKGFVKLADVGRNPPSPGRPSAGGRGKSGASGTPDAGALRDAVKNLYDRAADPTVTEEQIRVACAALGPLKKDQLVEVAATLGLLGVKVKNKDGIVAAITERLLDRKGSAIRKQMIHRPAEPADFKEATPVPTTSRTEG